MRFALTLIGFFAILALSALQSRAQNGPNGRSPEANLTIESPNFREERDLRLQNYDGTGPINTDPFTVKGAWEINWYSTSPLSIVISHVDGSADEPAVQQQEPGQGTLLETKPGTFFLKIAGTEKWSVWLTPVPDYTPPTGTPVVPQPLLTADQVVYQNCIVLVKGGSSLGIGFLVKKDQTTYAVVTQSLVANNANLSFLTTQGIELKPLSMLLARDRDIALVQVNDPGGLVTIPYSTTPASSTQLYGDVFESGFKQGSNAVPDNFGKLQIMGPLHLGVAAPVYIGLRGTPLIDIRTKTAIGVVTETKMPHDSQWQRRFHYDPLGITFDIVYDALRFDNVLNWEPCTFSNFYVQTHFIESFHEETVEIRSFLNPGLAKREEMERLHERPYQRPYPRPYPLPPTRMPGYMTPTPYSETLRPQPILTNPLADKNPEPDEPFRKNSKLVALYDQMHSSANLKPDDLAITIYTPLSEFAQEGVSTIQKPALFNSYNRTRALEELGLRNAVLGQIHDRLNAGKQSLLNPLQ